MRTPTTIEELTSAYIEQKQQIKDLTLKVEEYKKCKNYWFDESQRFKEKAKTDIKNLRQQLEQYKSKYGELT